MAAVVIMMIDSKLKRDYAQLFDGSIGANTEEYYEKEMSYLHARSVQLKFARGELDEAIAETSLAYDNANLSLNEFYPDDASYNSLDDQEEEFSRS